MDAANGFAWSDQLVRRPAAVFAIDVFGYSQLMERDEAGTHLAMKSLRLSLIDPSIQAQHGRMVKYTGDRFLAEFPSALDAMMAAIHIQRRMVEDRQDGDGFILRIGVNVGEIIVEPEDIYGDGVNIAARLEGIAEPGGIALSQTVYDQVHHNLSVVFDDLGTLQVKNISREIRAFALPQHRIAALPREPFGRETAEGRQGVAQVSRPSDFAQRLSIAVLPFENESGDSEQAYFADGIVEDIITALSRFRNLFVIARNSSFAYKGRAVDAREAGRDLNVRYVVKGGMRRVDNFLRITAQLVDARSGAPIWFDHFDGDLEDVFALQDKVTQRIVTSVEPRVRAVEIARAKRKPVESLTAYDYYLRAVAYREAFTKAATEKCLEMVNRSLELLPNFGPALALKATCFQSMQDQGWRQLTEAEKALALDLCRQAIRLDPDNPVVLCLAGHATIAFTGDYQFAVRLIDSATRINPNYAEGWIRYAMMSVYQGEYGDALRQADLAIALSPHDPLLFIAHSAKGYAHFFLKQFAEAEHDARLALRRKAGSEMAYRILISALVEQGKLSEARGFGREMLERLPDFTISKWRNRASYLATEARWDTVGRALLAAGIPM
ncbi:adenylate/guanylate cyclase domain-containing protein [Methylovirgula sp. 4M-Z18]|uniref:adenylate/guanylate cyclase domain-containing protein n=1 Tax=Methylovirgula sp. 4M-Z18 TaxID=2293567 RepID=UPI000E2EF199|nr:adenylate/guanylate cyclase domain-containing protein [Methylovirgula sp. 4M-Z18]RFB75035.1 hypothetical protein DYH55_22740 [Methylovirgula sp. 4M-Z18]